MLRLHMDGLPRYELALDIVMSVSAIKYRRAVKGSVC